MSRTIDERVLEMRFENDQFEHGIRQSADSLEMLRQALKMDGAGDSLQGLQQSFSNFDISHVAQSIDTIAQRATTLGVIGDQVIRNLVNAFTDGVTSITGKIKDLISTGGLRRAMNIEEAKFQLAGLGVAWEDVSGSIDYAVQGTAYSLDQAALAASLFAASGVELGDKMSTALRAVSGTTAMSRYNFEQIANIFATVSANGKLMTMQLRQLSYAGLDAGSALGKYLGKTSEQIEEMVSKGQIDFDTFAAAMDSAFGEHAKEANQIFSGALENMQSALGRIGEKFWTPLLQGGRNMLNSITPVIDAVKNGLAPAFQFWDTAVTSVTGNVAKFFKSLDLEGLTNTMSNALTKVKSDLYSFIFTASDPGSNLARVIAGLGAAFDLLKKALGGVAGFLKQVWDALAPLRSAFGDIAAIIGDALVALNEKVSGSNRLIDFLKNLSTVVTDLVYALGTGIKGITEFFSTLTKELNGLFKIDPVKSLGKIGEVIETVYSKMMSGLGDFKGFAAKLTPVFEAFGNTLKNVIKPIKDFIAGGGLTELLQILNQGLMTYALANIMDFGKFGDYLQRLYDRNVGFVKTKTVDLRNQIRDTIADLGTVAEVSTKFSNIEKVARSILMLAIAMKLLSTIDGDAMSSAVLGLAGAITALGVSLKILSGMEFLSAAGAGLGGFIGLGTLLVSLAVSIGLLSLSIKSLSKLDMNGLMQGLAGIGGAMFILVKGASTLASIQGRLAPLAGSMILLAVALNLLAIAVRFIGSMKLEDVGKGLLGLGGILLELSLFMGRANLSALTAKFAAAMLLLGLSLNEMAVAMKILSSMSFEQLGTSLAGMGGILLELGIFIAALEKIGMAGGRMAAIAAGLLVMGIAMNSFAIAMQLLARLDWGGIGKGLASMGGILTELAIAVKIMENVAGKQIVAVGASLLLLSIAFINLATALTTLEGVSWETIQKGLVMIGGALLEISIAMAFMEAAGPALAGLAALVGAFSLLIPALISLSAIPIPALVVSLVALAAVLGMFAGVGVLLAPLGPALLMVGGALALFGVGVMGVTLGIAGLVAAFGSLIAVVGGSVAAAIAGLIQLIRSLAELIPYVLQQLGLGIVEMAKAIGNGATEIIAAVEQILVELLGMIQRQGPTIISTVLDLVMELIRQIDARLPEFVDLGMNMLINLVKGIGSRIGELVNAGVDLVVNLVDAIGSRAGDLANAGVDLVLDFINAIADTIRTRSEEVGAAAANLGSAIVEGVVNAVIGFGEALWGKLKSGAEYALGKVKSFLGIASPSKVFRDQVGKQIVAGMAVGVDKNTDLVNKAMIGMAKGALTSAQKALKINSPSVVFKEEVGRWIAEGITEGIKADATAEEAMEQKAQNIVDAFKKELDRADLRSDIANLQFELWKAMNPKASEAEQQEKNIEMLDLRLEQQQKKIDFLKDELQQTIEEFGEASDQAMEAQKEYLQAQKDYYDTVNELNSLKGTATAANENLDEIIAAQRNAMHEAEKMMQELMEINERMNFGWSMEEMRRVAAERTGYDEKVLREAMGLPTTTEVNAAVEDTAEDFADITDVAFGGNVGEHFTDIGEAYAVNLGDGFIDEMANQKNNMVAAVQQAQKELEKQAGWGSKLVAVGTPTADPNVKVFSGPIKAASAIQRTDANVNNLRNGGAASTTTNITNNYSMTQNNTSPEALSEAKIYRQTSNLFSSLKNANGYNKVVATA